MYTKRNRLNIVKLTKKNFTTLLRAAASAKNSKTFQNYKKLIITLPIFKYVQNQLNIVKLTKRNFTTLLRAAAFSKNSKTFQIYKKLIIKLPIFGYDNNRKPTKYCKTNIKEPYILCYGLRPPLKTAKHSKITKN